MAEAQGARDAFERCLKKLTLDDVRSVIRRADTVTSLKEKDGKPRIRYRGYTFY